MSAAVLREAASLMRERATLHQENARMYPEETGGPNATYAPAFIEDAFRKHAPVDPPYSEACEVAWETAGEHYAAMHPRVALAVADWLDSEADAFDAHLAKQADPERRFNSLWTTAAQTRHGHALAVARAYLNP